MSFAAWICAAITTISAYVSLGYSIAGVRSVARGAHARDAQVGYRYALARSVALAVVASVAFFTGSTGYVAAAALAMVVVQAGDAVVGAGIDDRVKTYGPAATAVVNAAALVWLLAAG